MANNARKEPAFTLTSGPVTVYPCVQQALAKPVPYDYDPYFQNLYEEVCKKTARALRCEQPATILHCEPAVAIEAAAASALGRGDVVLNLVSGVYGKGFGYWAARYCKELVEVEVGYDDAVSAESVDAALSERPEISVVSVVHHDTPSGTLNPIDEIGNVVQKHGKLLLVDAVSSFAGMDVHPDACHADIFITGPGKCLGGSPGLSILNVSDAAWNHIEANPDAPSASVLSLADWKNAWSKDEAFPFTPSVAEVHGLEAAIDHYMDEGPEAVWRRHAATAAACRAGIKAMGQKLWPVREEIAAPSTTAVRAPEGFTSQDVIRAARELYGVTFSSGRGETWDKLVRMGHMGPVAEPIYASVAVSAYGGALRHLGIKADVGAGVEAALAAMTGE